MLRTSLVVKSGIASFDQAILSTASFAISIILIKTVSTAEFGHYSVALPVSLFLISIQNAVINAPLIVLLAAKRGDEKRRYAGSLCYGQLLALVPAVTLGLVVIAMLTVWKLDASVASIAAALCLASIGILLREFLRAYFFADESPLQVLKVDGLYIGLVLSFIAFTHLIFEISVASVFLVMGVSSLLAGLAFSVGQHWRYESESIRQSFHENWHFGKWALLGVIVTHIQNYSYLYFLGVLLGSVAVADVSASRLVLTPLLLAHAGWNTIAVPHGSRLREERRLNRFFHLQVLASLAFTLGTAAYLIVLMIFSGLLETLLFSGKYESSFDYLPFWGIIFCVRFLSVSASCGLQALKDFKIISKVNCLTMLLTVVGTYFLIRHYAVKGGLVALILGESLLAVTLWFYFAKTLFAKHREQHAETRTPVALFGPSDTDSVTLVKE